MNTPIIWASVRVILLASSLLLGSGAAELPPLRVSFDPVVQPVSYLDGQGQPTGFAVDYVRALVKELGGTIEVVTGDRDRRWAEFNAGRVDVIATLVFSEERAKTIDFSLPYLTLDGAVFVRKGTAPWRTVADLAGRRIAVSRGNITHSYLLAHPEWGAQIVPVDSTEAALRSVNDGGCDAAVNIDLVARQLIRERGLGRVERSGMELPGLVYKYHLGVRRGETSLLRRINEAHFVLHERGEFQRLHEKWIGPLKGRELTLQDLRPLLGPAVLLTLVVVGAFAWQRHNLRRLSHQAEALRRGEQRLNLVLEGGRHSLWDWDVPRNRVVRSPMLAAMLGYRPDELAPNHEGFSALVHPGDQAQLQRLHSIVSAPGQDGFAGEARLRTKAGEWMWCATVGRVLHRGPDGVATRVLGTHTDITQRKQAEDALQSLNLELERRVAARTTELATRVTEVEHLNHELEAFSSSVSHDLRAPLRNITGFLELLSRRMGGRMDPEEQRYVATVTRETGRMGALIDDLLAFSRVGRAAMNAGRVALDELVEDVRADLQPEIGARAIEWKIGVLPALKGDRALLRQVLVNLLGNAVKFTRPRDPAVIEVGVLPAANFELGKVTIFVRDNGVGFNPRYQEKLFGVFQRLHHQRDFEGTGIGLANVKRIITRHGGRVWAEGSVDKGAAFYFTLSAYPP